MKKRYDEIMDRIEISDEMRSRILNNIGKTDFEETQASKIEYFPIKRYLPMAACFAVLLVGALMLPNLLKVSQPEGPEMLAPVNNIAEVNSIEELSAAVGFEVTDIAGLPFAVAERTYTVYWQELAEVNYSGEGQSATFRKSVGAEDNSGDYNVYDDVKEIDVGGIPVTIKGTADAYVLAVWLKGDFSYSVLLSDGISETEWYMIISEAV